MDDAVISSAGDARAGGRVPGWLPLAILATVATLLHGSVPSWVLMWILAVAIFAGFKYWGWSRALNRGMRTTRFRSLAFLCLWPGMDAGRFLDLECIFCSPPCSWLWRQLTGPS